MYKRLILLLILAFSGPFQAWSVNATESAEMDQAPKTASTPDPSAEEYRLREDTEAATGKRSGDDVLTLLIGLVGVLAVIAALVWLSRRLNVNIPGANQQIKIVSALSVGVKEKLIVVNVDGERLLLGVTAQNIRLLKTLDADSEEPEDPPGEFAKKMRSFLRAGAVQNG